MDTNRNEHAAHSRVHGAFTMDLQRISLHPHSEGTVTEEWLSVPSGIEGASDAFDP